MPDVGEQHVGGRRFVGCQLGVIPRDRVGTGLGVGLPPTLAAGPVGAGRPAAPVQSVLSQEEGTDSLSCS